MSSDLDCFLPETENRKWIRHSNRIQWRHQHGYFRKQSKIHHFQTSISSSVSTTSGSYSVVSKGAHPPSFYCLVLLSRRPDPSVMAHQIVKKNIQTKWSLLNKQLQRDTDAIEMSIFDIMFNGQPSNYVLNLINIASAKFISPGGFGQPLKATKRAFYVFFVHTISDLDISISFNHIRFIFGGQ